MDMTCITSSDCILSVYDSVVYVLTSTGEEIIFLRLSNDDEDDLFKTRNTMSNTWQKINVFKRKKNKEPNSSLSLKGNCTAT